MDRKNMLPSCEPAVRAAISKLLHQYGAYTDEMRNEVTQSCMCQALEGPVDAYNGTGDFQGWIVSCAKNHATNILKAHHNSRPHDSINSTGYTSDDGASVDGVVVEGSSADEGAAPATRKSGGQLNTAHINMINGIERGKVIVRLLDVLATLTGNKRVAGRMIVGGRRTGIEIALESGLSTVQVTRLRKWLASEIGR